MPRLKLLLAMLTGFALGVALCAAWFLARQPPALGEGNASDSPGSSVISPTTDASSVPWRVPKVHKAGGTFVSEPQRTRETEDPLKSLPAHIKHEVRIKALGISSWLRLDSRQEASLEAEMLKACTDGILAIPADIEPWIKANLSPEEAKAYTRYWKTMRKDEAEARALDKVHEMARAIALTEEQRDALYQKEYHQMLREEYSVMYLDSGTSERLTAEFTFTESPIEMPVFTNRFDGEILTEEQRRAYSKFQERERELNGN